MARSRGTLAFLLAVGAVCSSAFVLLGGFWLPAYQGEIATGGTGAVAHTSATLVDVNGLRAVVLLGIPLALTLVGGIALHLRCARGSRAGSVSAWLAIGLLAALTLLGAASVGIFVLPAVLLLAAAARLTPAG